MKILTKFIKWSSARPKNVRIDTVVLHATAGSTFKGAWSALLARECSYHYIVEDQREMDGFINKLVALARKAWHAGQSFGPQGNNVNDYSVGISLVNLNNGVDPYSEAQFESTKWLILELKKSLPLRYITTHAIVSPGRKTDPLKFPIERLAQEVGLELWRPN